MSKVFLNSTSVQQRFLELLDNANGILALLDLEEEYRLLENGEFPTYKEPADKNVYWHDIDVLVQGILGSYDTNKHRD
jgi:hypothetical protein